MSPTNALSPLAWLMLVLSFTTGLVDAVSVLGLGKVFTANMTGNIVFLGFAIAGAPGFAVAPYLAALASFLLGALLAGRLGVAHRGKPLRRWLLRSALIEAALLWIAAALALDYDVASLSPAPRLFMIIALTGIAMGYRNGTVRQLKVPDLTTTVLTLTLTGLAADSHFARGTNPNWGRRMAAVGVLFLGALAGGTLVLQFGLALPLAVTGVVILAATIGCSAHPEFNKVP